MLPLITTLVGSAVRIIIVSLLVYLKSKGWLTEEQYLGIDVSAAVNSVLLAIGILGSLAWSYYERVQAKIQHQIELNKAASTVTTTLTQTVPTPVIENSVTDQPENKS